MNNRSLLSKAAIDTSALGTGGKMNAEQANKFITYMKDYSQFLQRVTFIEMQSTKRMLDFGEVSKRNMRKQKENDDNPATGTLNTKQRELEAVGVIMPYDVSFQFMKENIEKGNINETLAQLFAQQMSNDTVDLAWNGDESSEDEFIKINNGWIKLIEDASDSHKLDSNGITSRIELFRKMLEMVPSKYFQLYQEEDKSKLKIFVPYSDNRAYKQELTERNTALGDSVLISGKNVTYDGFEIVPVGFIPEGQRIISTYENLAYGVYGASLEVYHEVVPRKTRHEYTLLADFDFQIHNPDAIVSAKTRS